MKYRLHKSPEADRDTDEIADYLTERSVRTAERFLNQVESTLERIRLDPGLGMHLKIEEPQLYGVLWHRVEGFPNHLIFFQVEDDSICVLRILHGARDWKSELDR
ncbi:MAG: type II toxin-antitoxin system RelE/ParE family toxin [Pirellulaceae bacterium]